MENNIMEVKDKGIELTGKVILDDETLEALKKEVRKEVLNDIKEDGLSYDEACRFATEINNAGGYMKFMKATLPKFINKVESGEIEVAWNHDILAYKKLKMCRDILEL